MFGPSAKAPDYLRQERPLAGHEAQLADRDVTKGAFFAHEPGRLGAGSVSIVAAAQLRSRLGVPADRFTVLLVGKDGGVKLTRAQPIGAAELVQVIDAMPMRRAVQR